MKTDEQILNEIAKAARGLLRMSESDYAVEPFRLGTGKNAPDDDALRRAAAAPDGAKVETRGAEDFFRPDSFIEEKDGDFQPAAPARVRQLSRALTRNLSDLKVYRVGDVDIAVYVLGRSAGGSWLGVSTRVVET
jgi:hypothetical protein